MAGGEQRKTVIEAGGRNLQYWRDLWHYRGLAFHMARRDFSVRYKQTVIGLAWSLLNPLLNMLLLSLVFGTFAGFGQDSEVPYYVSVFAGVLPWTLFSRALTVASGTLLNNAHLMTKVYFPRLVSPLASAATALIDALISYLILFLLMGVNRYLPPARILLSFPLLLPIALLGTCLGLVIATMTVRFRDLNNLVPYLLQIGQYVTPVAFSMAELRERLGGGHPKLFAALYYGNPMTGLETAFKWAALRGEALDGKALALSFLWLAAVAAFALLRFRKVERTFVDIV
ncbi:MAG: ABC transporter permease [Oscillospiraceae bacterium]|jgi:lipopolysaccharide transport system permease protein|nr:ABC transporter permease [Oscillospiraceae bacterium]